MAVSGGFTRRRRWAGATEGALTGLVVLLLVGAIVYAATRPALRVRADLTQEERFTLTEQTRQVLAELDQPVRLVSIMQPERSPYPNGLAQVQARAAEYVNNLLDEYALASGGTVVVERLSPYADPLRVEEAVREHSLSRYNLVLVEGRDRTVQVFLEEMVTIDRGLAEADRIRPAELVDLRGEGPLTSALLSVTSEVRPRVDVLTGHGEPRVDDFDDAGPGLGRFVQALEGQGLQTRVLELFRGDAVPNDTDVVVVVGPRSALGAGEVSALIDFVRDGGALLLALDPLAEDGTDRLLEELGLERERAILCRPLEGLDPTFRYLLELRRFGAHPVTAPIQRQGVFGRMFRVGGLGRTGGELAGRRVETLLLSDEDVFGDRRVPGGSSGDAVLGDGELMGPRSVAWAVEGTGRAVVVGSASFVGNNLFATRDGGPANIDLAVNAVNWLADREDALATRPRLLFESRVDLLESERADVFVYIVVLMPLAGAALGAVVWFRRRR